MALEEVVRKLAAPMSYLRIFHSEKIWFDLYLPLFFASFFTAGYTLIPMPFPLLGTTGLIVQINGLLQVLIGFYIAALAAVATFQGRGMDGFMDGTPPTLKEKSKGLYKSIPLSRRRFLSYLFGYLALMSLAVFFSGVVVNLVSSSLSQWISSLTWAFHYKLGFLFTYLFLVCNIFITTMLGLYYLTVRIHQQKGEIRPPSKGQ